ncbi:MAG: sulfatase-like hydrolase/transferase [Myxococcota bacterium]|nr:sulfatase-like hydrolase/transferase [Myxococcota bacterium]
MRAPLEHNNLHILSLGCIAGALIGACEGVLAGLPLTATLAAAGLWSSAVLFTGALALVLLRLCLGHRWIHRVSAWAKSGALALSRPATRARGVAAFAALLIHGGLSAPLLIELIERFHRSDLIAYSFLTVQLIPLSLAFAVYRHLVAKLAKSAARPSSLINRSTLWRSSLLICLSGLIALLWCEWGPFEPLDGPLVALIAAATLLWLIALIASPSLPWGGAPALLLPLLSLTVTAHSARQPLTVEGYAARQWLIALARFSDFDRDGVPALFGRDCAPFDPNRHPNRDDPIGDDVDQDCNGVDGPRSLPLADQSAPAAPCPEPCLTAASPLADARPTPANLILITVDTLRPDHMSFYGYGRKTTPELDIWLSRATSFDWAYAPNSGTGPSLWALMAGRAPLAVPLQQSPRFPPDYGPSVETLAAHLGALGYQREAVLCGRLFQDKEISLFKGIPSTREVCGRHKTGQAARVTKAAISRLRELRRTRRPFFLWVHYYDPHLPNPAPRDPPPAQIEGRSPPPKSDRVLRYDSELRRRDQSLSRLLSVLFKSKSNRWPLVALSADHGEDLGELGGPPHARRLVSRETRVPLVFWGAGLRAQRFPGPASTLDIFPTFLRAAGAPQESPWARDLSATLLGLEDHHPRPIYQENLFSKPRRQQRALVDWPWHLIYDQTLETWSLYDLAQDPEETQSRWSDPSLAPVRARLKSTLFAYMRASTLPYWLAR